VSDVLLAGTALPGDVWLRALSAADAEVFALHIAADLERLSEFLPWPARTADTEGAADWLGRYDRSEDGRDLVAGVWAGPDLVGGIVLFQHHSAFGSIELGCWSVAAAEGKGVVRAACVEGLRHARRELGVERVEWHCDPRNTRSRALAGRLGFRFEGTMRSSYVLRGERCDTDLLSLVGAEIDTVIDTVIDTATDLPGSALG
jgi:ribosomal-protein-serine acetyltransferase